MTNRKDESIRYENQKWDVDSWDAEQGISIQPHAIQQIFR
jgi:hypothetical protein